VFRAKFRVLSRTEESNLRRGDDDVYRPSPSYVLGFRPVNPKNKWSHADSDYSEENARFWDASPSGEFSMQLYPEEAAAFPVGQAVFVDFEPDPEGGWIFGSLHINQGADVELRLHRHNAQGSFKIGVQLPSTVESILTAVDKAARVLLERKKENQHASVGPEMRWSLTVTPVPG
jgi:hypothetical protein